MALGTPDNVVEAELEVGNLTIGDVGLQVAGADVSTANPVPTNDPGLPDTLGQKTSAASLAVTVASDQSVIPVVGPAADGAAVSGAPVRIGVKDGSGNTQDAIGDTTGNMGTYPKDTSSSLADTLTNSPRLPLTQDGNVKRETVYPFKFNGGSWDRPRNNHAVTVLASAARTATNNSADQVNYDARGLHLIIDVTAIAITTLTIKIQGKDPVSGKYYDLLTSAAIAIVSTIILRLYPGLTAAANLTATDILPRDWRVVATHSTADSTTYSVAAQYVS